MSAADRSSNQTPGDAIPSPGVGNAAIAETYDRIAVAYDWLVSPLERTSRERALALFEVRPGDRVLELGSGPGHALVALAERVGPDGSVLGLDAAPGWSGGRADR